MKNIVVKTIVLIDGVDCGTLKSVDFSENVNEMIQDGVVDNDNDSIVDHIVQEYEEGGF